MKNNKLNTLTTKFQYWMIDTKDIDLTDTIGNLVSKFWVSIYGRNDEKKEGEFIDYLKDETSILA